MISFGSEKIKYPLTLDSVKGENGEYLVVSIWKLVGELRAEGRSPASGILQERVRGLGARMRCREG
jgi:hypothetical protein